MRWFARKPKAKAPVLKAPADRVRVRRIRSDLPPVEPSESESSEPNAPAEPAFNPGPERVDRYPD